MADEKPRKERKTTTRAPRKRAGNQTAGDAAPTEARAGANEVHDAERPVLAIEESSDVSRTESDDLDEIRRQAYELYVSRGGDHGGDLSDWLEAERIVRRRRNGGASGANDSEAGRR